MAMTQYKCINFASCDKALSREVIEIEDGEDPVCPACGEKLELLKKDKPGMPKWLIPVGALAGVAGLAALLLMPVHKTAPASSRGTSGAPGSTVAPQSPLPAQECTDRQLAVAIKDRLGRDEDLKGNSIQVDVVNQTVILSGTVENDMARNYAADLAHKTGCPIASVVNDLKLGLPDQVIANQIRRAYAKDPALKAQPVRVEVSRGNVVLSGSVSEPIARTVAADVASRVQGAATVTNNLVVRPVQSAVSGPPRPTPNPGGSTVPVRQSLTGVWEGTFQTCAQGQAPVHVRIVDAAPDDITASVQIMMPNQAPGTFTASGILNTMNSFLALQFKGWEHQPPGLSMGNIGGYIAYANQKPGSFSGVVKSPGCGQFRLQKE